jgi:hypothetical protein
VLDPISIGIAINAMQTAFTGIQYCCEALSDGKVQVQKIKKAAEDAQAIVHEVKSAWSIIKGLFRTAKIEPKPTQPIESNARTPNLSQAKQKDVYVKHIPTEAEIVQQFVKNVGDFYHHHRELSEIYDTKSEEVYAMDRPDPRDILILSQIKHELDGSYMKLSGMMRGAHVPPQLGPLWDNFHAIYENAKEKQQARRERDRIRRVRESSQRRNESDKLIDFLLGIFMSLVFAIELWAIWIKSFID